MLASLFDSCGPKVSSFMLCRRMLNLWRRVMNVVERVPLIFAGLASMHQSSPTNLPLGGNDCIVDKLMTPRLGLILC